MVSNNQLLDRRRFLSLSGSSLAGLTLATCSIVLGNEVQSALDKKARRTLRLAHMTDLHVQPERWADKGLTACLHHVQNLKDRADLIITGGDTVMDSFSQDDQRATLQWNLFHSIMKSECSLPVKSCVGNHDTWGWNKKKSKTSGQEPHWGKQRAIDELKIPNRFYSFDQAGWHFIILDGTHTDGKNGYIAKLDEEQFSWLSSDLANTPSSKPVLIVSHQPILSIASLFRGDNQNEGVWTIPSARMLVDAGILKDLFKKHPDVKLCLSGHLHLVDCVHYCGVTYLCNGAVSGAWWKGDNQECDEGYGLIDLYEDGTFAHQYVAYNWTPMPEPKKESMILRDNGAQFGCPKVPRRLPQCYFQTACNAPFCTQEIRLL
ncbi:MAG: metallophosphoesterase [Sedimentisphaerales bacterium]|nr:metallophosphoesterase [Sedimentisphaerales bacterium]